MGPTSMSPDELATSKRTYQTITRSGSFDAGHRVMNERLKCYNLHGHTYLYELEFSFNSMKNIGYAIDFKEIKRVGCQWIEDFLDHAMLINPEDTHIIQACNATNSKAWYMSLNGIGNYCNPTVENIAKEMHLAISCLLNSNYLHLTKIKLYETPNCFTECYYDSITHDERKNFYNKNKKDLNKYKDLKGVVEYDDRNI